MRILAKATSYSIDEDYDESAQGWCKMTSKFPTNIGIDKTWMSGKQQIYHEWKHMCNFCVLGA